MKKDEFSIRLNETDFLVVDWAYQFPVEGYVARLLRNGIEIYRSEFFKDKKDCIVAVGREICSRLNAAKSEVEWCENIIRKLENLQ